MQTNSILLQNLSIEGLQQLINVSIKDNLQQIQQSFTAISPDELLTREQTCQFLQIDSSTLWHWTNKGKVNAYGISNRRYYKKSELLESLIPLKK